MSDLPYGFNEDDLNYFTDPTDDFYWQGFDDTGFSEADLNYFSQAGDNFDLVAYLNAANDPNSGLSGTDIDWGSIGSVLNGLGLKSINEFFEKGGTGSQLMGLLGGGYGIYNQIDWQQLLAQGRDLAGKTGSLISGYTPYTGKEVADLTSAQQQGVGYAPGLLQKGNEWFTKSGDYDPNELPKYLNPYTQGALTTANRLTSENLMQNILPGINSTFTGQGQFGASRNAEFTNRAIQDTQQAIADANAKTMVDAYGKASDDYMSILKQQGALGQQAITQGMGLAGTEFQNDQAKLTGALEAWKRNREMPIELFKEWGGGVGNFNPAGAPGTNTAFDPSKLGV